LLVASREASDSRPLDTRSRKLLLQPSAQANFAALIEGSNLILSNERENWIRKGCAREEGERKLIELH
jgi:hypothetical protein